MKQSVSLRPAGFSLIELIAVIGIIVLVAAFAVPATTTILRGSQLTQASQVVSDQLNLARQVALSKNRMVEVRFIRFGDPEQPGEDPADPTSGKFRAMQIMEINESGVPVPVGKIQLLPNAVMMNEDKLSSILDQSSSDSETPRPRLDLKKPTPRDPELPRLKIDKRKYEYVSFRFLPDGSTNLMPSANWYLTLHSMTDRVGDDGGKAVPPPNFFTVQIDPISGATKAYRPSAG